VRKRKAAAVCLLVVLLSTAGCWDQQPIDRLTIVYALGFDPAASDGQMLHLQTVSPVFERDARTSRELMDAEGVTFDAALQTLQRRSNARLVLGKVKVVALSEELCRLGIKAVMHQLDRDYQFNTRAYLLVTEDRVADVFRFTPQETERIASYIEEMVSANTEQVSAVPLVRYVDFMKKLDSRHDNGYIPLLSIVAEGKALQLTGLAVFRHDKMVGKYDQDETLAVMLINGNLFDKAYTFEMPDSDGEIVTVRIMGGRRRLTVADLGRAPEIEIRYTAKAGYLEEHKLPEKIFEPEAVAKVEKALSENLTELANRVMKKQQGFGSDVFGIGPYLAAFCPAYMQSVDWEETFPRANIKVSVDIRLDRVGIRQD